MIILRGNCFFPFELVTVFILGNCNFGGLLIRQGQNSGLFGGVMFRRKAAGENAEGILPERACHKHWRFAMFINVSCVPRLKRHDMLTANCHTLDVL
jgi:hypothetical protein